ncbi:MAG: hypothetical protein QW728_00345 [Thermoplasmata archaeon]
MAESTLTAFDMKLFEFIRTNDFVTVPWNTAETAKVMGCTEEEIYSSLGRIAKEMKGRIYIFYREGSLHIQAE